MDIFQCELPHRVKTGFYLNQERIVEPEHPFRSLFYLFYLDIPTESFNDIIQNEIFRVESKHLRFFKPHDWIFQNLFYKFIFADFLIHLGKRLSSITKDIDIL